VGIDGQSSLEEILAGVIVHRWLEAKGVENELISHVHISILERTPLKVTKEKKKGKKQKVPSLLSS
jgi:hypothetical protein